MKVERIAVVGLGSIGRRHLRLISKIRPEIEIIVVRSGYGAAWKEEKIATKIVTSIEEAIQWGIQAAIISSPASLHLQQSLQLANSGVNLLIEKPLSNSLDGIEELLKTENENGIIAQIGYVLRYDPGAIKFKQWLDHKNIGEILHARIVCGSYLPDWRPGQNYRNTVSASQELGGGVLFELSHELDYLHWFFGKPIDVQAILRNSGTLDINVEDQADLLLTSSQNYPIIVQLDFNRHRTVRECQVILNKGELIWNATKKDVSWRPYDDEPEVFQYNNERDYMYNKQIESFLESVEKKSKPAVTIHDGIAVMQLIEAARNSNTNGCKTTI
jgi:predicted dehydrogenase